MTPLEKGINFVRDNPQLLYTMFLVVAIPLAFLYTSDKFLSVARDRADVTERDRVGILEDAVSAFLRGNEAFKVVLPNCGEALSVATTTSTSTAVAMNSCEVATSTASIATLVTRLGDITNGNETITELWVVAEVDRATSTLFTTIASTNGNSTPLGVYKIDGPSESLFKSGLGQDESPRSLQYVYGDNRIWRTARTIMHPYDGVARAYIFTDTSMSQIDVQLERDIWQAYGVLAVVIVGIMLLLARQARITDYATLYRKLADVDKMKDDFVSMAAHELRSPLTTIRGYADLIRGVQQMNEKGEDMLVRIERSADDLNTLIGDILDVARLQEGRMSFNLVPVDPDAVISDVVEAFKKPAADKGLEMSYVHVTTGKPLPSIKADTTRLRQVLINFVGNAVKYTPSGSVKVIAKVVEGAERFVEIRVSDTGLGVSAEAQKHLFEKFYRVKTVATSKIVGTGLGLWITKEIVEKMGGNINVESIEGKGSDFIVRFPIAKTTT